jgi:phosphoglycolate phosphatase-like HAD superfamily hydrolase
VLIGDSVADLDMSINSGIRFIGVKTGLHSNRFLLDSRILVDTLLEVKVGKNVN